MNNKISKDEVKRICQAICDRIGESYKGSFSFEMDVSAKSMMLSLRGEKNWYKARNSANGIEVFDNSGKSLGNIPGIFLPSCEAFEEFNIESEIHYCKEIFEETHDSVKEKKSLKLRGAFVWKILPAMSTREVLETIKLDLSKHHDIFSRLLEKDEMLWLSIEIPSENMPQMRLVITSQPSGKTDENGALTERVVILRLFTRVFVTPEKRGEFQEKINLFHNRSWAGCFRIHEDNEIEGSWAQNVLEGGLFVDYIWDGIIRILTGWKKLHQELFQ